MQDDIRWKFVAAIVILAFVVSLVSGMLGGVGFGALAMRALIVVVLFSIIGIGLNVLLANVFPELFTFMVDDFDDSDDTAETGSQVDIVADDDIGFSLSQENDNLGGIASMGEEFISDDAPIRPRAKPDAMAEIIKNEHEPSEMAQAIRTVMNKDEEG